MSNAEEIKKRLGRLLKQIEFSTGQKQIPDTKRTPWRYTWVVPATAEFADPKNSSEPLYITTRTISAEGLDFHSPRALERGSKILIKLETEEGELQVPATVIHSTPSVGMPLVGVTFDLEAG